MAEGEGGDSESVLETWERGETEIEEGKMKADYVETWDEWTIEVTAEPEDMSPWDEFDAETAQAIESGELMWFCAKVTASRAGVELAREWLGECCWESLGEFLQGEMYAYMRRSVVEQAKQKIKELNKWLYV